MPFKFNSFDIPGPVLVEPAVFGDGRGFFLELYKHSDFVRAGIPEHFVQDNYSRSSRGVLRGLHYQKNPKAQGKLVRCIAGEIFDVAVDIRKGSPFYGKWIGQELSADNRKMLYVPAGFAHGFLTLSETADILYKCTEEYSPENDRGIIWNDPEIAIPWQTGEPLLSGKDIVHPRLRDADINFKYAE
ncbi:MAG: dTDP-4-dehydrorhamnose 3,5-epimerase [Nitrospirota bacterium]|nr:dTDP-4-dehydrorhamnose 3,5-epimerase [Nitrospirota bacterium]